MWSCCSRLIGWLVTTKRILDGATRKLITVGYLAFVAMNIAGLLGSFAFAEAIQDDLLRAVALEGDTLKSTATVLEEVSYSKRRWIALGIHGVMGCAALTAVWRYHRPPDAAGTADEERI